MEIVRRNKTIKFSPLKLETRIYSHKWNNPQLISFGVFRETHRDLASFDMRFMDFIMNEGIRKRSERQFASKRGERFLSKWNTRGENFKK